MRMAYIASFLPPKNRVSRERMGACWCLSFLWEILNSVGHHWVRQIFRSCSSLGYEIGATRRVEFRSFVALAPREPLPVHSLKTRPVTAIKSAYGWENLNFRYPIPPKNCKFGLKSCSGISALTRSFRIQNWVSLALTGENPVRGIRRIIARSQPWARWKSRKQL